DRDAKRRASWTPAAHRLAEIYSNTCRKFTTDLNGLVQGNQIQHLRIGTLEGLSDLAMELVSHLTTHPAMAKIRVLELNTHDLNELEQAFGKQDLDVIFTSREPGRKKYRHIQTLGYQTIEKVGEEGHAVRV